MKRMDPELRQELLEAMADFRAEGHTLVMEIDFAIFENWLRTNRPRVQDAAKRHWRREPLYMLYFRM